LLCRISRFSCSAPAAAGKSTWLREVLPKAAWFDLLRHAKTLLDLSSKPEMFASAIEAPAARVLVVVDEVQRLPTIAQPRFMPSSLSTGRLIALR